MFLPKYFNYKYPFIFNECKVKEHTLNYGKTMSMIIKVIIPVW